MRAIVSILLILLMLYITKVFSFLFQVLAFVVFFVAVHAAPKPKPGGAGLIVSNSK